MESLKILIYLLFFLFIILLLYFIIIANNNISGYKIIKTPFEKKNNNNIKCIQKCNKEICDNYHSQMINYDLCKECKKENKCLDPYDGTCKKCFNDTSCETIYGCNNKRPINPLNNYCNKCWK
jgi:hypothetical protein